MEEERFETVKDSVLGQRTVSLVEVRLSEGFCPIQEHTTLIGGKAAVEAGATYYDESIGCECGNPECNIGVVTEDESKMSKTFCRACQAFWNTGVADDGVPVIWCTVAEKPQEYPGVGLLKIQCGRGILIEKLREESAKENQETVADVAAITHISSMSAVFKNVASGMGIDI